jgi:hypothetical protein
MFVTVTTNDGELATVNTDQITHMTIAVYDGAGSRLYFTSNTALSVRQTMDEILQQMRGDVVAKAA